MRRGMRLRVLPEESEATMNKKTKKLIKKIEDATGCTVLLEISSTHRVEHFATLQASGCTPLYSGAIARNERIAVEELAEEIRYRGKAMAKVKP